MNDKDRIKIEQKSALTSSEAHSEYGPICNVMTQLGIRLRSFLEKRRGGFGESGHGQPRIGLFYFLGRSLGRDSEGTQTARRDSRGFGIIVLFTECREAHGSHDES